MIMAEMAAFDNLKELAEMADNLATFVRKAAVEGAVAHEVEKGVWQRVLAMGRQATGQFFQMQGDGDVGETIEMPDGEILRRLPGLHRRTYRSIFGLSLSVDSLERMSVRLARVVRRAKRRTRSRWPSAAQSSQYRDQRSVVRVSKPSNPSRKPSSPSRTSTTETT